jgi:hypothetical protein
MAGPGGQQDGGNGLPGQRQELPRASGDRSALTAAPSTARREIAHDPTLSPPGTSPLSAYFSTVAVGPSRRAAFITATIGPPPQAWPWDASSRAIGRLRRSFDVLHHQRPGCWPASPGDSGSGRSRPPTAHRLFRPPPPAPCQGFDSLLAWLPISMGTIFRSGTKCWRKGSAFPGSVPPGADGAPRRF